MRPYQEMCRQEVAVKRALGHRCIVVVLPPNAGKTVIYEHEIRAALARGWRVCVAVPNKVLMVQTIEKMAHLEHGVIWGTKTKHPERRLQVASVMSLARRLKDYPHFDLIIMDEAHHCPAKSWMKLLSHYTQAQVLGLTATPKRPDGKGLDLCGFTEIVRGPWIDALTPEFMSEIRYWAPNVPLLLDAPQGVDYTEGDLAKAGIEMGVLIGDAIKHYHEHTPGKRGLAFCMNLDESRATAARFEASGVRAVHMDKDTPEAERARILRAFNAREIDLICSVGVLGEGLDVPGVEVVILLRPTRSVIIFLQQIGRGLRQDPDDAEKVLDVIDCAGNWFRFWSPALDRKHGLDGTDHVSEEEEDAEGKRCRCEKCKLVGLPGADGGCPRCGAAYTPVPRSAREGTRWRDGELVRVGRALILGDIGGTRASRRCGHWDFWMPVGGGSTYVGSGHVGASEESIIALLSRVNDENRGKNPPLYDDWRAQIDLRPIRRQSPGATHVNRSGAGWLFTRHLGGMRWWARGHSGKHQAFADAVAARADEAVPDMTASTEDEWIAALECPPKKRLGPARTRVKPEAGSWRFSRRGNGGREWVVRGYPGKSEEFVLEKAAGADELLSGKEDCTKGEWRAALGLPPKPDRKQQREAKEARKRAYAEQQAAWAKARALREAAQQAREDRQIPRLASRPKNGKQQYYVQIGKKIILGVNIAEATVKYAQGIRLWEEHGRVWPEAEDERRKWFGLEPKIIRGE